MISLDLRIKWFDLHLRESQRVTPASPAIPDHAYIVRRVSASVIETVQVGVIAMNISVPPGTFVPHCTRV